MIFYEVQWHLIGIFHHIHGLPFVPLLSDRFQKIELLMGLTQLTTLKMAFWKEYLEEHLSVIARWNRNEKIYKMEWLEVIFSDLRRSNG